MDFSVIRQTINKYILDMEGDDVVVDYLYNKFDGESFASKINRGMYGNTNDIVILHTDMVVLKDWFRSLKSFTFNSGVYGSKMVFSANPKVLQHFGGHITADADAIHPERGLVDMGQFEMSRDVPFVTFGGCWISRKVIDKVGYLDEAITPWGFEDVDYCLRAKREGFPVICTPALLWHDESRDAKTLTDLDGIIKRNRDYVMKKHNVKVLDGVPKWV